MHSKMSSGKWQINYVDLIEMIEDHFDVLVQDCSNSTANALELLQSCTKPLIHKHVSSLVEEPTGLVKKRGFKIILVATVTLTQHISPLFTPNLVMLWLSPMKDLPFA